MTATVTHTPIPWRIGDAGLTVFGPPNGGTPKMIASRSYNGTKSAPEDKANLQLIVRAVNSHAELLEACRKLAKLGDWTGATPPGFTAAWEAAVSAIAKASQ